MTPDRTPSRTPERPEPGRAERDADINAIVKPFESMWTEPGLSIRKRVVEELARLAISARDERDAAIAGRAPGYTPKFQELQAMTLDQLRLHVLMAEAEIIRLREYETEENARALFDRKYPAGEERP